VKWGDAVAAKGVPYNGADARRHSTPAYVACVRLARLHTRAAARGGPSRLQVGDELPAGLAWIQTKRGGRVNLCEEHARRLASVLRPGPALAFSRFP
jgi:hypothetical protein